MLRVTVDINGRAIGRVAAVKQSESTSGLNEYEVYDVRGVKPGESVTEEGEFLFTITHRYEDGASKLVEIMMRELESLPK